MAVLQDIVFFLFDNLHSLCLTAQLAYSQGLHAKFPVKTFTPGIGCGFVQNAASGMKLTRKKTSDAAASATAPPVLIPLSDSGVEGSPY